MDIQRLGFRQQLVTQTQFAGEKAGSPAGVRKRLSTFTGLTNAELRD
jgi:hypothetical protein